MRLRLAPSILLLALGVILGGCAGTKDLPHDDGSIGSMVYRMASNWGSGDPDAALVYADRILDTYGDEAREIQASLSDFPATDPPEETYKYNTLNLTGLAAYGKGEILRQQGDTEGAVEAYTMAVQDFGYAQLLDYGEQYVKNGPSTPRLDRPAEGKWWRPADLAQARLDELAAGGN